jgi:hypothetical protein
VKNSKTFHEKFSILHSSPVEEKKFSPFSENGPSAIQGERATSPFFILQEWEESGVTTPNIEGVVETMFRM